MADEPKPSEGRCDPPSKKAMRRYIALAVAAFAIVAIVGGFAGTMIGNTWLSQSTEASAGASRGDQGGEADDAEASSEGEADAEALAGEHVHDWTAVYELVDVPAVTHVEHHDAVYGTETTYETVCNDCDAIVTGVTREHTAETGHTNFTTNVPIENETVEQEAYDETVVDTPATVQLVHTSDQCSTCGETRDVEDEVVQTMDGTTSQQ